MASINQLIDDSIEPSKQTSDYVQIARKPKDKRQKKKIKDPPFESVPKRTQIGTDFPFGSSIRFETFETSVFR